MGTAATKEMQQYKKIVVYRNMVGQKGEETKPPVFGVSLLLFLS